MMLCSIQAIIVNRFFINLRRVDTNRESLVSGVGQLSRHSVLNFRIPNIASIIGDMDQPLDHGPTLPTDEDAVIEMDTAHREAAGQSSTYHDSTVP